MFPFDLPDKRLRTTAASEEVDAAVAAIIAKFGFKTAIPWLLHNVSKMAEQSLSAPTDKRRRQRFVQWSNAVQRACRREGVLSRSFDQLVNSDDRLWAGEIGIRLS